METEKDLREYVQLLRDVVDGVGEAVALLEMTPEATEGATVRYYSRAFCELTGYGPAEALGKLGKILASEETDVGQQARFRESLAAGRAFQGDLVLSGAQGHRLLVEASGTPLSGSGAKQHYVVVLRDLAERRLAEATHRREAERHSLVLKATDDVVWEWDLISLEKIWSANLERVFGYRPEEARTYEWWLEHVHPDDREELVQKIEGMASSDCETVHGQYRFLRANGTWASVQDKVYVIRNADGGVVRLVGAMRDLTEQLRMEARLARLIDQSRDLVAEVDLQGRVVAARGPTEKLLGYRAEELQGKYWPNFVHPDDVWLGEREVAREFFTSGRPVTDRLSRLRTREGHWRPFLFTAMWQPEDGTILAVGRDVSAAHEAQERLRESEERYRTLFHQSPMPKIVYDPETLQILDVNDAACRLYGYSHEEFKALTIPDIRPAAERTKVLQFLASGPVSKEPALWLHQKKDGTLITVEVTPHLMMLEGRPVRLAQIQDVTERIEMEERLRQMQKMEAVGQLAGGIAHDFNNILTVINGFAERLQTKIGEDRTELQHILEAGRRAAGLTQQLLVFSRKQVIQTRAVDLNGLVQGMQPMLRRLVPASIEISFRLHPEACVVDADQSQLEQVVLNLAINAADAMEKGGRLHIDTRRVTLDTAAARQAGELPPGEYVALEVADTGHGIEKQHLSRIFEPFFTTKEKGRGTGLGLPTVYGIVRQGGGHVTLTTELGSGTTFRVLLPFCPGKVEVARPVSVRSAGPGKGTVLVVEDDEAVRGLMMATLEDCGYRVLAAGDGAEALAVSRGEMNRIDLLVTDVVMPGMSGGAVAEQLSAMRPEMKVLFVSGYTEDALVLEGVSKGRDFLAKPFTPYTLGEKVRSILTARAGMRSILLVDDEAPVRRLFREVLEEAGYRVREAPEGKTALGMLEEEVADLMITDLVMPEREGIETILDVRKRFESAKIIAISGAFGGRYLQLAKLLGAQQVLQKPVRPPELLAAVREVLAG